MHAYGSSSRAAAAPGAVHWPAVVRVGELEVSPLFPARGTLCSTAPSLPWVAWASLPHLPRYYAPLRLPPCPSRGPSLVARSPIPCSLPSFVVSPQGSWPGESSRSRQGLWSAGPRFRRFNKETGGSPKFPSSPFGSMPRSQTPVVSWALAIPRPGLLPSGACKPSAFPSMTS